MKRILVIEDEKNFASYIRLELVHEGYQVKVANDGLTGLEMALKEDWDVLLLDMMLPGLNGIEVCRRIRQVKSAPILMITARDSISDRVMGLDSGADDYIPKPFAIDELFARIRAIFRRVELQEVSTNSLLQINDITIDPQSRTVKKGDQTIDLTKREYDLLFVFVENVNLVMTRDMLLDKVWGYDTEVETNVVDVYVRYLRNKIDTSGKDSLIHTLRGVGYVMRQ
jgi:DNA-binding response OmpR family regulator